MEGRAARLSLAAWTTAVVLFLWIPLVLICVYAFNSSNIQSWPIAGFSFKWFSSAWHNGAMRQALGLSLKAAFAATGIALASFFSFGAIQFSIWTIVIGHATFCVVIVYNNVLARLRRTSPSLLEASMDLGADGWQTFRFVTFPVLSTALVAGGLLAFALSFDEVIVTTFTAGAQNTLPIWILGNLRLGQQLPQVNVVVFFVIVMTVIPVWVAQRLTRDAGILRRR